MRQRMVSAESWGRRRCFRSFSSFLVIGGLLLTAVEVRSEPSLFLGVTTSTENSGLLAHIIEAFEAEHDIGIRAVTAGSGAVLNLASRGDVDIVLVHSPEDEETFLAAGYGIDRRPVMRNRFVIIGPRADPAGVQNAQDARAAFSAIAAAGALFLSRGDESGTHKAERQLWQMTGLDPDAAWYRESGSGQGATLNIAVNTGAYTLTDEATWATFGNPGDLETLFAADEPALDNPYSVIRVDPERHRGINAEGALIFADWLTSKAGQAAIGSFRPLAQRTMIGRSPGEERPLFRPVAQLAG